MPRYSRNSMRGDEYDPDDFNERIRRIRQRSRSNKTRIQLIEDTVTYYRDVCQLQTQPGSSVRWFDLSDGSNCVKCADFFRTPRTGTKKHKLWLSPRGSAKSTIMAAEVKRKIQLDPEVRVAYLSETEDLTLKRPKWIKARLEEEARLHNWPSPKTKDWSDRAFTVKRASGLGFDYTVSAGSVDKPSTGSHWHIAAWDDPVGEYTNQSAHMRRKLIDVFEDFCAQRMNDSEIWIVGTLWPHYNLYSHILDHWQHMFEIVKLSTHDEAGDMTYPWHTDTYLAEQRTLLGEAKYRSQMLNEPVGADELLFSPEDIDYSPLPAGLPVSFYLITDLGTSEKYQRKTSESAMFLVGLTSTDDIWLLDGFVGKGNIEHSGAMFLKLLTQALSRKQYPRIYTMETQGPGGAAWAYFENIAKQSGLPPIVRLPMARSHTEKHARIQLMYPYMKGGKYHVDPRTFPASLFRKNEKTGMAHGKCCESMTMYTPYDDDNSYDDLDAWSDAVQVDKMGQYQLPRPVPVAPPEKPMSDYDKALKRAMDRMEQDIIFIR